MALNERIRELADQCYHRYSEYNINLEKFAELIVKECAGVCNDARDSTDFLTIAGITDYCAKTIMKRFGVEE